MRLIVWVMRPRRDAHGNPGTGVYASCRAVIGQDGDSVIINTSEGEKIVPPGEYFSSMDECIESTRS